RGAQAGARLEQALEMRARSAALGEVDELGLRRLDRGARNRAAGAGVQVGDAVEDGEGGAQLLGSHAPQVRRPDGQPQTGQLPSPERAISIAARRSCSASGAAAGSPWPPTAAQLA